MVPATQPASSQPIPQNLKILLPIPQTPWNMSSTLFSRVQAQQSDKPFKLCEVLNTDPDFNFILKYFEHQKPVGYSIKRVVCIHNSDHTQVFEGTLKNQEREASNLVFAPMGKNEEPKLERARVLNRWESQASQFSPVEIKSSNSRQPDICSKAKVLPLWHGSSEFVCKSVCSSGFTSFGKHHHFHESASQGSNKSTDKGFFGSGIYFTNSARYAAMYSSEGHLLLSWVSMREPYPVVNDKPHPQKGSDMIKLGGKEHYQNYNAHFIPVASIRPQDPKCIEYYPCYKDQPPAWDEFVVFHTSQALPRFWIELGVDFPTVTISSSGTAGELLTLILSFLDKIEIQNHAPLTQILQAKVALLLDQIESTPLGAEDQKFLKLAKRLYSEEGKISSSVAIMLIKGGSGADLSLPKYAHRDLPKVPGIKSFALPSSVNKIHSSHTKGEEDYQEGCQYKLSGNPAEAFICFKKAAEQGHLEAEYQLFRSYMYGEGVPQDPKKAEEWCQKAGKQGHLVAQGDCYYYGFGLLQDYKEAMNWYRKAAAQGNPFAQFKLGFCYSWGQGVGKDEKEGVKWFLKAAEQSNENAQFELGFRYLHGTGVEKDYEVADKWFQKAAEQWDEEAIYDFGVWYSKSGQRPMEAIKFYRKAADKGHVKAQYLLGVCYATGQGVAKDEKEAAKWYQKAAQKEYAEAQYLLGVCYATGQGVAKDEKEAAKWYQKAATGGNARAQHNLAMCYATGQGLAKDEDEAFKWYQKAAEQGDTEAQCSLGYRYAAGRGVAKDEKEAIKWYQISVSYGEDEYQKALSFEKKGDPSQAFISFQKAANQGHIVSQFNTGNCFKNGLGVAMDEKEAVKWYQKAAEQGHVEAQFNLAGCYIEGKGVCRDGNEAHKWYQKAAEQGHGKAQCNVGFHHYLNKREEEAFKWFQKAAEQGVAYAQFYLGNCFESGEGVTKDEKEAVKWYQKAAEQGNAAAQYNLGFCYTKGQGVTKDEKEAVKWYRKAAEQGNAAAQYYLGVCYAKGQGVTKDVKEAVKWFQRAADQGSVEASKALELLLKKTALNKT